MKKSEQLRFWQKVRIGWPNDCWLWQAGTDADGYGKFGVAGRTIRAHRYALLAAHDMMDDPRQVLHSCDVPACCNPAHMRLGTHGDNMADRGRRGRTARLKGSDNGQAKLTENQAQQIKRLLAAKVKQREIAAAFGISQPSVSQINTGRYWGHVK